MNPTQRRSVRGPALIAASVIALATALVGCTRQDSGLFATPEAAVQAMAELVGMHDDPQIETVFGPGSTDLFHSGDDAADREDAARVRAMIEQRVEFEEFDEETLVALFGEDAWPWPIPLVRAEGGWRFDTAAGRDELLNRRIGRNELWTLTALHEIVDAQREYRRHSHDGTPRAYAQRFRSSEGRRDGLYWPVDDDGTPSPLGELLADSDAQRESPQPFHGYYYRMLTRQGDASPGGARDYLDDEGLLTGGFAVIAWPAKYGNSGVMTFITNQRGLVYEKDLGPDTAPAAEAIDAYDPDTSWTPTGDLIRTVEPD